MAVLGTSALNAFVLGAAAGAGYASRSNARLRTQPGARQMLMLFIQGLPDVWTNTNDEAALAGSDPYGLENYTIHPGLEVPDITRSIDVRTGKLKSNPVSFKIQDFDGRMAELFGTEPPTVLTYLAQDIAAGTGILSSNIIVSGQTTTSPATKYIGIERIGDGRERNQFWPFHFTATPGPFHPGKGHHLPPIPISDDPLIFEGRIVTLYRFWYDDRAGVSPRWGDWSSDADLVWWGVLRDRAEIGGDKSWSMSCYGPEGLLKKQLGKTTQTYSELSEWWPFFTEVLLSTGAGTREDQIAVGFTNERSASLQTFSASLFDAGADIPSDTPQAIRAHVASVISDVANGTDHITTSGRTDFVDYAPGSSTGKNRVRMDTTGAITIQGVDFTTSSSSRRAILWLAMHEKAWKAIGWDPALQRSDEVKTPYSVTFFNVDTMDQGMVLAIYDGDLNPGGPGYWLGLFHSGPGDEPRVAGFKEADHERTYRPVSTPVSIIDMDGDQTLRLFDAPYIEPQTGIVPDATATVDVGATPTTVDAARYFLIKGETALPGEDETREVVQVAKCSWKRASDTMHLQENDEANVELHLETFLDPRAFGINEQKLSDRGLGLVSTPDNPGGVQAKVSQWIARDFRMVPLNVPGYKQNELYDERAPLLLRTLLSTGTGSLVSGFIFSPGSNDHSTQNQIWAGNDFEIADLGLGIPTDLVADDEDILNAYDEAEAWNADHQKQKLAFLGPRNADEILDSLTVPVGMGWRLHGAKYGVFHMFSTPGIEDADITITEADKATTEPPRQGRRTSGQFSSVELSYRTNPIEGGTAASWTVEARDFGARSRPGDLKQSIRDLGLPAIPWWGSFQAVEKLTGVGEWRKPMSQLWGETAAEFYAQKNFVLSDIKVSFFKGQDIVPGTLVSITDPWPLNPITGTRGLTAAVARVLSTKHDKYGNCTFSALVYAGSLKASGMPRFAPVAMYAGYDSGSRVLYLQDDWPTLSGTNTPAWQFEKPSDATGSGNLRIRLFSADRRAWGIYNQTSIEGTVETVDADNNTLTIASPGLTSDPQRDTEYMIMPADIDDGDQGDWPKDVYGIVVLDTGQGGSTPTTGKEWIA